MIYLRQDNNNTVVKRYFDLLENCGSTVMWRITNAEGDLDFTYMTEDLSERQHAYNMYEFNLDFENGSAIGGLSVPLKLNSGHYYYTAYEVSEFGSLDPANIVQTLGKGILFVQLVDEGQKINNKDINNIYY